MVLRNCLVQFAFFFGSILDSEWLKAMQPTRGRHHDWTTSSERSSKHPNPPSPTPCLPCPQSQPPPAALSRFSFPPFASLRQAAPQLDRTKALQFLAPRLRSLAQSHGLRGVPKRSASAKASIEKPTFLGPREGEVIFLRPGMRLSILSCPHEFLHEMLTFGIVPNLRSD